MITRPLKIAHVSSYYTPALGGVATVVGDITRALARRGHEVHAFTACRTPPGDLPLQAPAEEILDEVRVHRLRTLAAIGHASFCPGLHAALVRGRFDVIHVHGLRRPHGEIAAQVGRQYRTPVVLHVHGGFDPRGRVKKIVCNLFDAASRRGILNQFDHYLALTPVQCTNLDGLGIRSERVSLFPNALSEASFLPGDPVAFLQRHGLEGRRVVLFLGALNSAKRCDLLVQAWPRILEQCPGAFLIFAGPDGGTVPDIRARIGRLGLAASCRWIGPLHGTEKRDALAAARLLALPSDEDAAPMALLEALAQGTPVVASTAVGTADHLLTHGVGHVFPRGNAGALVEKCLLLLSDSQDATALRRRARAVAQRHFRLETNMDALEILYARLIDHSPQRSAAIQQRPVMVRRHRRSLTKGG